MFTAFISKAFIDNIYGKSILETNLGELFIYDFFPKLNISNLVCDFDAFEYSDKSIEKLLRNLIKDGVPFNINRIISTGNLEELVIDNFESISKLNLSSFKMIFFLHSPIEIIRNHNHLKEVSIISSVDFDKTFQDFLIDEKLENDISQSEYFQNKKSFNPFYCNGSNTILIDDTYFLIKSPNKLKGGKIFESSYIKQIEEFIDTFIEPSLGKNKTLIFFVPTFEYDDSKLSWTKEEQDVIRTLAKKTVENKIPTAKCQVYFHSLKSHSRKVLTNKHFYKMDLGFDFIKRNIHDSQGLKESGESISFKSVYLRNKTFNNYLESRILKSSTKAVGLFK